MALLRRNAAYVSSGVPAPRQLPASRDRALDGLRGLAVLLVFVFHYGGGLQSRSFLVRSLGYITQAGWTGVVLFFALSGFLITGSLWDSMKQPHWLRNFYARRALRILPLYYTVVAACTILAMARGTDLTELQPFALFALFLQDVPFLSTWALNLNPSPLPLYHLWTLAVEEQFYLLWPLLLLTVRKRREALRLSLWIFGLCAVFRIAVWGLRPLVPIRQTHIFDTFLLTHGGGLALGAALALALRSSRPGRVPASRRFVYRNADQAFQIGIGLFLAASFLSRSLTLTAPMQYMVGLPGVSLASTALIVILLRPGTQRHVFSLAPLGWLGRISYGFYIFHILLQPIFDYLTTLLTHSVAGERYQTVRLLIAFPLSLVAAWLSYHLLELPFLRRKNRFPMHQPLP